MGLALWYSAGGGGGSGVTSVGFEDGSTTPIFSVSGSPITSTGTLEITLKTQSANLIFSGPSSGSAAQPSFRSLVAADLGPILSNSTTINSSVVTSSLTSVGTLVGLAVTNAAAAAVANSSTVGLNSTITLGNQTAMTSANYNSGIVINAPSGSTVTAGQTVASLAMIAIGGASYASTTSSTATLTTASTVAITGPTAGSHLSGTSGYAAIFTAGTGFTSNYSAQFVGNFQIVANTITQTFSCGNIPSGGVTVSGNLGIGGGNLALSANGGATYPLYVQAVSANSISIQNNGNAATIASASGATYNLLTIPAQTVTLSGSTNVTTSGGLNLVTLNAPTYAASSAITVTNAGTLVITNAPIAGTDITITNSYSLWIQGGASFFNGNIKTGTGIDLLPATGIATSATAGFIYIPAAAGSPSGTPTNKAASLAPLYYDTTNKVLCLYDDVAGAWYGITLLTTPL